MPKPPWKETLAYYQAKGWSAVEITPGAGHAVIRKVEGSTQFYKTIFKNGEIKDGYHEEPEKG